MRTTVERKTTTSKVRTMYCLFDTFNKNIISRHRTVKAVAEAAIKLQNSLSRGSYLATTIRKIVKGEIVAIDDSSDMEEFLARWENNY